MKKLFENHIFHYSFVLTMVAFACGLVIGGVNAITSPIIEENRTRAQIEAYERVLPGISEFEELDLQGDPSTIISKVEGRNANGEIIGYIYVAYGTNKFGYMRIISSVGLDGKIIGASFLEINQTYNVNDTRSNLALYEGRNITEAAPVGDMISGVTGSKNTLVDLMADIARAHARMDIVALNPFDEGFDVVYTRINDDSFKVESNVVALFDRYLAAGANNSSRLVTLMLIDLKEVVLS